MNFSFPFVSLSKQNDKMYLNFPQLLGLCSNNFEKHKNNKDNNPLGNTQEKLITGVSFLI